MNNLNSCTIDLVNEATEKSEADISKTEESELKILDVCVSSISCKSVSSDSNFICRICQSLSSSELVTSPCFCKGSLAFVHLSCLENWLNHSGRDACELCGYQFIVAQTRRYGFREGIRVWVRIPQVQRDMKVDLLVCILLTLITAFLMTMMLLGKDYFIREGKKAGFSETWASGALSFFLGVIGTAYCIAIYLLIKDQIVLWYRWWQESVSTRVIIDAHSNYRNLHESCGEHV